MSGGAGVGRPGVSRGAVERGVAVPLALGDEAGFWSRQQVLWAEALCRPGEDGAAERLRVDPALTSESWTAESARELARAARACLACRVAAECAEQMARVQMATGVRLCSVSVAGQQLSWRGREGDDLLASAGWAALPLRVVSEEAS